MSESAWIERWDRQQGNYLPDRDAALGMVLDVVDRVVGEPGRLVDLASGPGSIAVRAVKRFGSTRALAVDAVCSATSLHYFSAGEFAEVARMLARRIRPDGVFVNLDTLRLGGEVPRLSALAATLRDHSWDGSPLGDEADDWESWWADARAEPAFAELFAERDRLAVGPTDAAPVTLPEMTEALRLAGFAEVGVLDQTADKHLIVAIR
ncbi:SAM-dependent methyltransferase [Kribbella sp. NBC_01245]|uniref:SAM-dependent methyltransferase n=1 Tax=Kribbella sp. NBC_01245 TaxID=2903578 RepID=UPI002E2AD963|nr:SAM-dependent methyltransferase [Kribbella sp. NBC_01245]